MSSSLIIAANSPLPALIADRCQPRPQAPFPFDAFRPFAPAARFVAMDQTGSAAGALAQWRAQILAEELKDWQLSPSEIIRAQLDPRDGAFHRGGAGLAYTPHAWGQLIDRDTGEGPTGRAAALAWLHPAARSVAWATQVRPPKGAEGLTFRTYRAQARLPPGQGVLPVRVLRGIVTQRHSLDADDDQRLAQLIEREVFGEDVARWHGRVWRDPARMTHATFSRRDEVHGVSRGFTLINSEVGLCGRTMRGWLSLDVLSEGLGAQVPDGERWRHVQAASGVAHRRHTLPRVGVSAQQRTEIARQRFAEDFDRAWSGAEALAAGWERAHADFPDGLRPVEGAPQVLADLLLERQLIRPSDLEVTLEALAKHATVLSRLPWGSAAYMAGLFALMAEGRTYQSAREYQMAAGAWILGGWAKAPTAPGWSAEAEG